MSLRQLFDQIRGIFNQEQSAQEGFVRENLVRSDKEQQDYALWCERHLPAARELLALQYLPFAGKSSSDDFFLLETPMTRGIILRQPEKHFGQGKVRCLFDWLCEQVGRQGYYRQHADVRSWLRSDAVERLERRHFKARFTYDEEEGTSLQLYGNITLEHRLIDDQSTEIRLVNHPYSDRSWSEALPFEELIHALFRKPD